MSLLNHPFDPEHDAALVTGAGNGIGRAIAQALVAEGVRTVFADVREDTVAAAVASSPRPDLAVKWVGDLARRDECDRLLAAVPAAVGRVTHFVHSASPQRHEKDHALAVTDETWQSMRAVNVDAGFHLARELARTLIAARVPGSFLMLTSLHAGTPRNLPHYSSSKAALAMLVKELARTLGRFGIRVNALVPGRSPPAASSPTRRSRGTFLSGASGAAKTWCRWRWPCCRTACRPTSPGRRSWSTAACR